jgi:hypothetical protein
MDTGMDAGTVLAIVISTLSILLSIAIAVTEANRRRREGARPVTTNHFHIDNGQVNLNQNSDGAQVEAPYVRIEMGENTLPYLADIKGLVEIQRAHIDALRRGDHAGDPLAAFEALADGIVEDVVLAMTELHSGIDRAQGVYRRNRSGNGNGNGSHGNAA